MTSTTEAVAIDAPVSRFSRGLVLSNTGRGYSLGFAAAAIWGLYLALSRHGMTTGLTAIDLAAFRYIPAGLIMLPWLLRKGVWRRGGGGLGGVGWGRGAVLALCAGPPFILLGVGGYRYAPLAHGAVLQPATVTIISMLLAVVVLGDRPTRSRLIGATVILISLSVIAGPGLTQGDTLTPLGDAMFVGAGVLWAIFTILSRRWGVSPLAGVASVSLLSGLVMIPAVLLTGSIDHLLALPFETIVIQTVVQGLLAGVLSVLAYTTAVAFLGPSRAAIFPALVPTSAILIGMPITGEWPNAVQLAGLGLASVGLMISIGLITTAPLHRLFNVRRDK